MSEPGGQRAARIAASGRIAQLLGAEVFRAVAVLAEPVLAEPVLAEPVRAGAVCAGAVCAEDVASAADALRIALDELPPRLAREVSEWQERVRQNGLRLDPEEWMLGLLTLSCLDSNAQG